MALSTLEEGNRSEKRNREEGTGKERREKKSVYLARRKTRERRGQNNKITVLHILCRHLSLDRLPSLPALSLLDRLLHAPLLADQL